MDKKKTETRKMTYGVSTTERSKDGFHVEIVDSRLNIGEGFDPGRRACTVIELREAADKLNAHDDLVSELQAAEKIILVMLKQMTTSQKLCMAAELEAQGVSDDGATRYHERRAALTKAGAA